MGALSFLTRAQRAGVLWNLTEHAIQVARLGSVEARPVQIDLLAELDPADEEGLKRWVREAFPEHRRGYLPGYCGFYPAERVLFRENINTRRLAEPGFLPALLAEHAKMAAPHDWFVSALHPIDGELLTSTTPSRPGLVLGLPPAPARAMQERLRKLGIRPRRLEIGSIALLGSLTRYLRETAYAHAVAVCEIGALQTHVYFLAKDGAHTPVTLPYGLRSIEETAMKETAAPNLAAARAQLADPASELRGHARRLVRMLTRHLKPAIGYFEMQTGQPVGGLFAAHLPEKLGWLEEALSVGSDLEFIMPDLAAWLPAIGVEIASGAPRPSRSWFAPFSLIGQLAPHGAKS